MVCPSSDVGRLNNLSGSSNPAPASPPSPNRGPGIVPVGPRPGFHVCLQLIVICRVNTCAHKCSLVPPPPLTSHRILSLSLCQSSKCRSELRRRRVAADPGPAEFGGIPPHQSLGCWLWKRLLQVCLPPSRDTQNSLLTGCSGNEPTGVGQDKP